MRLIEELRRRRVPRAAALYIAVAWAATEILVFLFEKIPVFPAWSGTVVAILFVLGFPVAMFLAWTFDFGPGGVQRTDPGSAVGRLTIAVSIALPVAATAGLSYLLVPRLPPAGSQESATETAAIRAPPNSVAVLPFANLSGDPDTEFFADGVAEEILKALARVHKLRVVARTSAFSFKNKNLDVREIARSLGVRHVVEGSVRRAGGRLRVTAKLIEAETGFQRWTESFDGAGEDVFGFQDAIAGGVAEALGEVIGESGLRGQARAVADTSAEAYDKYLLARQIWRQRDEGPIRRSIELLEEVTEMDPEFAPGWSALAAANLTLGAYAADAGNSRERARQAADRALALDDTEAEAHAVLASVEIGQRDWLAASARFRRASELSPNNPTVRLWHSELLTKLGKVERALDEVSVALEVDPLYTPALGNAGFHLLTASRVEEAAKVFQRAWDLGLKAMFVWVGNFLTALVQERYEDARQWLEQRPIPNGRAADEAFVTALQQPTDEHRRAAVAAVVAALERGMGVREGTLYLSVLGAVDEAYRYVRGRGRILGVHRGTVGAVHAGAQGGPAFHGADAPAGHVRLLAGLRSARRLHDRSRTTGLFVSRSRTIARPPTWRR